MQLFRIDLNSDPEGRLREIGLNQIKQSLTRSEEIKTQILESSSKIASLEKKLSDQQSRFDRADEIANIKYQKYLDADQIRASIKNSYNEITTEIRSQSSTERELEVNLSRLESRISSVQDVYSEDAIQTKLLMLKSLSEAIDTHRGINYQIREDGSCTVGWYTRLIRMKNGLGGWTEETFGPFSVVVSNYYYRGTSSISVECKHV